MSQRQALIGSGTGGTGAHPSYLRVEGALPCGNCVLTSH